MPNLTSWILLTESGEVAIDGLSSILQFKSKDNLYLLFEHDLLGGAQPVIAPNLYSAEYIICLWTYYYYVLAWGPQVINQDIYGMLNQFNWECYTCWITYYYKTAENLPYPFQGIAIILIVIVIPDRAPNHYTAVQRIVTSTITSLQCLTRFTWLRSQDTPGYIQISW